MEKILAFIDPYIDAIVAVLAVALVVGVFFFGIHYQKLRQDNVDKQDLQQQVDKINKFLDEQDKLNDAYKEWILNGKKLYASQNAQLQAELKLHPVKCSASPNSVRILNQAIQRTNSL
jgi:hypothetical protein